MMFLLRILCLYTLAKIKGIEMITLSNKKFTVTFHNYKKTWNEAVAICESNGGTLLIEDSPERTVVVEKFKADIWDLNDNSWIGLHYPISSSGDIFAWTNCFWTDYVNYKDTAEPKDTNDKKCVQTVKTGIGWKTDDCSHDHNFLCQTQGGDDCTFIDTTGIPLTTTEFSLTTSTTSDRDICKAKCLITIVNNQNCWGLNFHSSLSSNNCILYFTENPFYFTMSATYDSSGTSMSIKNCYYSSEDTTDNTPVTEDSDKTPASVCSSYTYQTTAFPTTSTTSTVEPPTTTTTTAPTTTSTVAPITTTTALATTSTFAPITTTNAHTTTSDVASTTTIAFTTSTACSCDCSDLSNFISSAQTIPEWSNMTTDEKVEYFVTKLRVDKTKLSSTNRKKISAQDERVVSKSVGYVSLIFIGIVFGLMILTDGSKFVHHIMDNRGGFKESSKSTNDIEKDTTL